MKLVNNSQIKHLLLFIFELLLLMTIVTLAEADMKICFLDVGQGDAALVICDGEAMLIDAGPVSASQLVYSFIRQETDELRYMIATHPHEDHIGGCAAVLNAVPVDVIFSPVVQWDNRAFNSMVKYAQAQGTDIIVPDEGDIFCLGEGTITILHCWPEAWYANDMSIVLRIEYGNTSFLFTGDAEAMSEYMMIDSGVQLKSDVLKVAHHGSRYSSTKEFLNIIDPQYAIISCGKNNQYGHPHQEVIDRFSNDTFVLRTDEQGTIVLCSDGEDISIVKPSPEGILSRFFH